MKRHAGFTLIEALVALMVFAILSAMAWRGLQALMTTRQSLQVQAAGWRDLNLVFARLNEDMRLACDRPVRNNQGLRVAAFVGSVDDGSSAGRQLAFTRMGDNGQQPMQRLGYRVRNQSLELLVWPVLDRAPDTQPQSYVMLDGVTALDLAYLDPAGQWVAQWPETGQLQSLPRALRVTIVLNGSQHFSRVFAVR